MKTMETLSRGDDLIASYSAKGPTAIDHIAKPDLVAPGNLVVSPIGSGAHTLSTLYPQNAAGGGYFRLSGTSMAAPVVSGAAALLLEQNKKLTPGQVKARLMQTATKNFPSASFATDPASGVTYASAYDFLTVGAGYLDILAALNSPDLAARQALSPAVVYDATAHGVDGCGLLGHLGLQCNLGLQRRLGRHHAQRPECDLGFFGGLGRHLYRRGRTDRGSGREIDDSCSLAGAPIRK